MSGAEQLRRLLAFLPAISDGQPHSIEALARQVNSDVDTILADLHAVSARAEDPPGWVEKIQLFVEAERVSMGSGMSFRRPMRLTGAEWRALELGLAMLRAESAPDDRPALERALEKTRTLMSEEPDDVTRAATLGAERHTGVIASLREAIRGRRRVEITYHKGGGDEADRRTICPFSFVVEQGAWYLVAHCDNSEDIRIFRLDRVTELHVSSETFEPATDLDVDALFTGGRAFIGAAPEKLRVRYSPKVSRWISEREEGTSLPDGSFEVELPLGDVDWAVRHVLQYGPEAEVISPTSIREAIATRLRSVLA